jgi:F-type H+-transporting ATPase subunit b
MQEMVHQLGDLVLQAVPTVLIILLFYFILRALFFKPLLKVMAEREARTAGAQKAAELAQAAAAEKDKQYHDALKQARAQVYAEQEAARKKLLDERAELIKGARAAAAAQVAAAKERIAGEFAVARRELETSVTELSAEIASRILPSQPGRPGGSARGAR